MRDNIVKAHKFKRSSKLLKIIKNVYRGIFKSFISKYINDVMIFLKFVLYSNPFKF